MGAIVSLANEILGNDIGFSDTTNMLKISSLTHGWGNIQCIVVDNIGWNSLFHQGGKAWFTNGGEHFLFLAR